MVLYIVPGSYLGYYIATSLLLFSKWLVKKRKIAGNRLKIRRIKKRGIVECYNGLKDRGLQAFLMSGYRAGNMKQVKKLTG
jgi:hypothetical protein